MKIRNFNRAQQQEFDLAVRRYHAGLRGSTHITDVFVNALLQSLPKLGPFTLKEGSIKRYIKQKLQELNGKQDGKQDGKRPKKIAKVKSSCAGSRQ